MIKKVNHKHKPGSNSRHETVTTVKCSLCGAVKGEDYDHYAKHVRSDHSPEDIGL